MTNHYDTASALQVAIRAANPDENVHQRVKTEVMIAHVASYIDDTYHDPAEGLRQFAGLLQDAAKLRDGV